MQSLTDKQVMGILDASEVYMALSASTGTYYACDDAVHVFLTEEYAKGFVHDHKNAILSKGRYPFEGVRRFCYLYGIPRLSVSLGDGSCAVIAANRKRTGYIPDPVLSNTILMIRQEKRKEYLEKLKDARFIMPVQLEEISGFPIVRFCISVKDRKRYAVAFSNIYEFNAWKGDSPGTASYQPLQLTLEDINGCLTCDGIIVNPESLSLLVTPEFIRESIDIKEQ